MKHILMAMVAVLVIGCSSVPKSDNPKMLSASLPVGDSQAVLQLDFGDDGQWAKLSTQGMAELSDATADSASATEAAYNIATLRAKRNLAEFLSADVRSSRTLKRIERTVVKAGTAKSREVLDDADLDVVPDAQTQHMVSTLTERISDQTATILKGTYVVRRFRHNNMAVVEVAASKQSIDAAKGITRQMSLVM